MSRTSTTRAAVLRRRRKHELRIAAEENPLRKLAQTWAWVYAEARRVPHQRDELRERVHQIGVDLTERGDR